MLAGQPQRVTRACVREVVGSPGRLEVDLHDTCGGCEREGPCVVEEVERLTFDLPPGRDLRVVARRYGGACDGACPEVCMPQTRTCVMPPLDPSGFHRVIIEGGPIVTLDGSALGEVCSDDVSGPPPGI